MPFFVGIIFNNRKGDMCQKKSVPAFSAKSIISFSHPILVYSSLSDIPMSTNAYSKI